MMRRMSAEQVWDSMLTLTLENPDTLLRHDDASYRAAIDVADSTDVQMLVSKAKLAQETSREEKMVDRDMEYKRIVLRRASELPQPVSASHFLRQFGQSDREIISSNSTEGTVPQLLTLFNGPVTHMMLEPGSLLVEKVMQRKSLSDRIDTIFVSIIGRKPTKYQEGLAKRMVAEHQLAGYGDIIWSLLNTREFIFIK